MAKLSVYLLFSRRRRKDGTFNVALCLVCITSLLISVASTAIGKEVPGYRGYVNDYAAMMSAGVRVKLERVLHSFDLSDSTQVAILTIDSLEGDVLEDFSIRVVDQWKIGQQNKDNGVLFLVVKNDRKMRIEVGRGLEHVLTDLAAGRIIDTVVAPRFKAGRFDDGFEAGILAVIKSTRGEYTPDAARQRPGDGQPPLLIKYLFFGAALVAFLGSNSRVLGVAGGAVLLPLIFFLASPGPASWALLLMLIPLGALGGLMLSLLLSGIMEHSGRTGGYYTGGGRGGGYYSGGGGFRSGGGFGGFGGGGFGGGGASGGW